jgi:uncharacterized alpha-E superfamily protein
MDDNFWRSPESEGLLDVLEKIDGLLLQLGAFGGYVAGSMTRTHAWRFLDLGRRLEHALQTCLLIHHTLDSPAGADENALEALLEICNAMMTYRSRYFSQMQLAPVLDLLVTDETNPGSVLFQILECANHVEHLAMEKEDPDETAERTLVRSMFTVLRAADVQRIADHYRQGHAEPLHELLDNLERALPQLSDAISHRFFFHSGPTVQLAGIRSK